MKHMTDLSLGEREAGERAPRISWPATRADMLPLLYWRAVQRDATLTLAEASAAHLAIVELNQAR